MSDPIRMPASYDDDISREPGTIPLPSLPARYRLVYALPHQAEICVSARTRDGLTVWAFTVQYCGGSVNGILLRMFWDAFDAFTHIPEFFAALPGINTLDGVQELLDSLGADDVTTRSTL